MKDSTVILILCFGCGLGIFNIFNASAIELDGIAYSKMAVFFLNGAVGEALKDIMHPLYPLVLSLFHFFINDIELAGRLISLLFNLLLIYAVFCFVKRNYDREKALYASFLAAIHPYLVRYSAQVLSESLATFLFAMSVFCFYNGWVKDSAKNIAFCGIFLGLAYLTKTEYIIYSAPLCLFLLGRKRFFHIFTFLFCLLLISFPYIYSIKMETGLWTITKKVCLSGDVSQNINYSYAPPPLQSFWDLTKRLPAVTYNFIDAAFIPYFALAVLGFRRVATSYRNLSLTLIVLHIIARAVFTEHSTRRYSVEFIPLVIIYTIEGIYVLKGFYNRFASRNKLYYGTCALIIVGSIFQGITPYNRGRALNKEAGLFLSGFDPGKTIISRLPLVSFYSKGNFIYISDMPEDCSGAVEFVRKHGVKYIVIDEKMDREYALLKRCINDLVLVKEFKDKKDFLQIYTLKVL